MSGFPGLVGRGRQKKLKPLFSYAILMFFLKSSVSRMEFHTSPGGGESPRAGICPRRPSKKYEKPKENDYFQWKSIKFLRKTKLLNMSVGGQSPAQIHERIFLLKKIDKKTPRRSEPATGVQPRFEKVNFS